MSSRGFDGSILTSESKNSDNFRYVSGLESDRNHICIVPRSQVKKNIPHCKSSHLIHCILSIWSVLHELDGFASVPMDRIEVTSSLGVG